MISSIFFRTSFAVLASKSTTNSKRPWISLIHDLRLRFRNFVDLCIRDWPLRYSRSNTLTEIEKMNRVTQYQFEKPTAWPRVQFLFGFICGWSIIVVFSSLPDKNIPSAAVLSVPKGRYLPDTGSQTSISPSNIMLGKGSFFNTIEKKKVRTYQFACRRPRQCVA